MRTSRSTKKARERLLYTATCLEILATVSIVAWVIPHILHERSDAIPGMVMPALWLIATIHLVILALLIRKIWLYWRGARLRKVGLVVPGIILVLMSMALTDLSGEYMEHQPIVISMVIILFISALFDLMTGIIMIMLPIRLRDDRQKT